MLGSVAGSGLSMMSTGYVFKNGAEKIRANYDEDLEDIKDEYAPCTSEQRVKIDEVKGWLLENFIRIESVVADICEQDDNVHDCNLTFDQVDEINDKMLRQFVDTQVFCPTVNGDDDFDTFGLMIRKADEIRPGQISLYPLAFDSGECQIASTFMHELAHVATGAKHNPGDKDDWVYLLGDVTKSIWKEDHGDCN